MKKIFLFLSFLIAASSVFSQTLPPTPGTSPRSNASVVPEDYNLSVRGNFYTPRFNDTAQANTYTKFDTCGRVIFTYDVMSLWTRACSPKRWVMVGTALVVDTTNTVRLSGLGSILSPLVGHAIISPQLGNSIVALPNGLFSQTTTQNGLISGGRVIWETGLTYTITAATYAINGIIYNSPETSVTLTNADVTFGRIDGFIVTTSSTATTLTGTPSDDPQNPSYTPSTQLPLTFTLVTANETQPAFCRDSIYYPNNGQNWTGAVSNAGRINLTSTNNPYSVTQDIEFTLAQNGDQLRLTKATVVNLGTYSVLVLKIRSKATWASTSRLVLRWYNVLTPLGIDVVIGDGVFGFNSSITNAYQTIVIPLSNFGSVTSPDNLLFTVTTISNNTIGLYADNIELLGCEGTPVPVSGAFWQVGGNIQATALVGGTRDNFPTQIVTNNTNHTQFVQGGALFLQGVTPGFSMLTGTFAINDIYYKRTGTSIIENTTGTFASQFTGNQVYTWDKNNNHIWKDSLGTLRMQLTRPGNLLLGTNADNASALLTMNSTTQGLLPPRMTTAQKNAIASPATGLVVYDTSLSGYYYYNGAAWVPFGNSAISSLTAGVATNTLNSTNFTQEWQWSTLAATGLKLSSISTAAAGNAQKVFEIALSGANATSTQTTYGTYISNTHTGTSSTNFGLYSIATGGSNNFGIRGDGTQTGVYGLGIGSFGSGVIGSSSGASGYGGNFENTTTTGTGINSQTGGGIAFKGLVAATSTNTTITTVDIRRSTTTAGATGIGQSVDFYLNSDASNDKLSGKLIYSLTSAADAGVTSQFKLQTTNAGTTADRITVAGNGAVRFHGYTTGAITGTPVNALATDATGNIIQVALGSGMTNPMTTTGDIIYSSDNSGTPARRGIGTAGQVLTVSGGLPVWVTPGVGGSVTSVAATSTDLTITGSPITTSGTFTFTLATVNGNVGTFGSSTSIPTITVNAKGLITAISGNAVIAPAGTLTGAILAANVLSSSLTGVGALASGSATTGFTIGDVTINVAGTDATGDMYYRNSGGVFTRVALGTTNQVLASNGTIPVWVTPGTGGTVTSVGLIAPPAGISVSGSPITTSGNITLTLNGDLLSLENLGTTGFGFRSAANTWTTVSTIDATTQISGVLPFANGGLGTNTVTTGQVFFGGAGNTITKGAINGTANQITSTFTGGNYVIAHVFNPTEQTLTDGATVTWNTTNGANGVLTLNGTGRTLTLTNMVSGYTYTLRLIQGSGGSKTVTTWTNVQWQGGVQPTLSTTAGATDIISLYYSSNTNRFYGTIATNLN